MNLSDRAEALEGIAQHLARFWDPRMRRTLLAQIDGSGGDELKSVVSDAIARHRGRLG